MSAISERLGADRYEPAPVWSTYSGKRAVIHALKGSYAEKRAPSELHQADRAIEAIEKLLRPPGEHPHAGQIDIYLTDPVADLPSSVDPQERSAHGLDLAPDADLQGSIVRVIEPEAPGEPIVRPLVLLLISQWYNLEVASIPLFTDGIAGVLAGRLGAGPNIKEADDAVRAKISAGTLPSILGKIGAASGPTSSPLVTGRSLGYGASSASQWAPDSVATSFVGFLLRSFGEERLREVLAAYDSERRDQATMVVYQRPLGALEESWLVELRRRRLKGSALPLFLRGLGPLIRPYWRQELELLVYTLFSTGYGLVTPLAMKYFIDTVLKAENRDFSLLILFIGVLLAIDLLDVAVSLRSNYVDNWINQRVLVDLRVKVFDRLQRLAHSFYSEAKVGDVMTRLSGDVGMVQMVMSQLVSSWLHVVLSTITAVGVLLALSPMLALISALIVPFFAVSYFVFRARLQQVSMELGKLSGEVTTFLQENLSAYSVIRAFGMEKRVGAAYHSRLISLLKATMRMNITSTLLQTSTRFVMTLSQLTILGVGGYLIIDGQISLGDLMAFTLIVPTLFLPVAALSGLGQLVESATGSLQRVEELLNEPLTIYDKPDAAVLPRLSSEIRLEGVTFGYSSDRIVLEDLSFTIPAGAHVAIVGPSGSGKSTIANLLLRFWDPQQGHILFDGHDLRDVTIASLRGQAAIVFQDTFVFDTTLRENIALSRPDATDVEIAAASGGAQLDSYVASLPAGYDTVLGERGVRMSGGQRQRLAIARALLRNPSILILDEATSALDAGTEKEILDTLSGFTKGRTTISITHRLSMAAIADRIYVLEGGKVVEQGAHAELVQAGGLYSRLYKEQIGHLVGAHRRVAIEVAHLRGIPLFASLPVETLASLAEQLVLERFSTGEDVVRQGEPGNKLYVISKGQVEVLLSDGQNQLHINVLNKGDYFGEMALLAGGYRTSTVRTSEPTELYSLSQADFLNLLEREPAIREAVSNTVAARRSALAAASKSPASEPVAQTAAAAAIPAT